MDDLARGPARAARLAFRAGHVVASTVGIAPGCVQANIVVLPQADAADFLLFCERNPRPCPIVAVTEPGDPVFHALGTDVDVRTDVPQYQLWRDGEIVGEPTDIADAWRDDLVAFALGCSYSFDDVLASAGVRLRHLERGVNPPIYSTSLATVSAGPFRGPVIVSMRPLIAADAIRAIQVTSRFPHAHGAPVHLGDPALIGIADLARPDGGTPLALDPGELPVFWACGVTPANAIRAARPRFCITHKPGAMLVTDISNESLAVS